MNAGLSASMSGLVGGGDVEHSEDTLSIPERSPYQSGTKLALSAMSLMFDCRCIGECGLLTGLQIRKGS